MSQPEEDYSEDFEEEGAAAAPATPKPAEAAGPELVVEEAEEAAEEAEEAAEEAAEEPDPLHIGNLVGILSDAYGYTVGRVVYRSPALVHIMPQEASDRAIAFPMLEDGSFPPGIGVQEIELLERQPSDHYVDFLGAKPGEMLEFFDANGATVAPSGEVEEIIKSATKDSIKLTDGRTIKFKGVGPPEPIIVVRVRSSLNAPAVVEEGRPAGEEAAGVAERLAATAARQTDILSLLQAVLPAATIEVIPTAERSYPDSVQREDMFQALLAAIPEKKRTNPRRIRALEREVDLAVALKNKSIQRSASGTITGMKSHMITTIEDAIREAAGALPAAIPIVTAARILNLDLLSEELAFKTSDVAPRSLQDIETISVRRALMYEDGIYSDDGFIAYIYDLTDRDQAVLLTAEKTAGEWSVDQDVIRTAGLEVRVQGLSKDLPGRDMKDAPPVSLALLISDVTDRSVRVITADRLYQRKTDETHLLAPSDPATVSGYVILPPKAALAVRPPLQSGILANSLLYSDMLQSEQLPTVAATTRDIFSADPSPQNAWTLTTASAATMNVAEWLNSVLKYTVHPIDSMGPRSPRLLGLLDTLGLGNTDLAPAVSELMWDWVRKAQGSWRTLLKGERKKIQAALDTEQPRVFQTVTGADATLWASLKAAAPLKDLLEDIGRRNPSIADAPTLLTGSLLGEAQGDAMPLVWSEIAKGDGRPLPPGLDPVIGAAALAASRAYTLRRKGLKAKNLLVMKAAPEINPCVHAARLESIRNVEDTVPRSRLMREFIEEFQGPKDGEWMTCILCKEHAVCYHELMELEALAQPNRMDMIIKQMMVKFGGDKYDGKILCRSCGQALQEIEFDDQVEFDDEGRPIAQSSVLTEEQIAETGSGVSTMLKSLVPAALTFDTPNKTEIGTALQFMLERGGLQAPPNVIHQIVRYCDLYVGLRLPPQATYEAQRSRLLTAASTKIKTVAGVAGAVVDVPTYTQLIDQLRVSSLIALTTIAVQSSEPPIIMQNPLAICSFSRGGYPFDPKAKPDEAGALLYIACAVASIDRPEAPWASLKWSGEPKFETRKREALKVGLAALQLVLGADAKAAPLSFTPEIRQALSRAQTDVVAIKAKAIVSTADQLPAGFRPEPFPPALGLPSIDRDPVPSLKAAITAGRSVADQVGALAIAIKQQAIATVGELHGAASTAIGAAMKVGHKLTSDATCCPVSFAEASGAKPPPSPLARASDLVKGTLPGITTGTHLWSVFEIPHKEPVEQVIEEAAFFKLFLKYCYRGPAIGRAHEFSVGNMCRQCGLALGKPLDLIDFAKEGATILGAQQGDLRVEVTLQAFNALSETVRRLKTLGASPTFNRTAVYVHLTQLQSLLEAQEGYAAVAASLGSAIAATAARKGPADEMATALAWAPLSAIQDSLRAEIEDRLGPAAARAMGTFDILTEDPFVEGPRAIQEYWCAKVEAASTSYTVTKVTGAAWADLSPKHAELINALMLANAVWPGSDTREDMRTVLKSVAASLGPPLRLWIRHIRGGWPVESARLLLQTLVLQSWRDALKTDSWMYRTIALPSDRERAATGLAEWTRALMAHIKQQFVRFSKDVIKRILQDRAQLDRETIVKEFADNKDEDSRAAQLLHKQMGIGRYAMGANINTLTAERFEFEMEQRHRMGIVDAPVDPTLLPVAGPAAGEDFGFGAAGGPEDGYDANQGADGDDY